MRCRAGFVTLVNNVPQSPKKDRLIKLNAIAIQQMKLLTDDHNVRKLEEGNNGS
jgi:hypothetical protein